MTTAVEHENSDPFDVEKMASLRHWHQVEDAGRIDGMQSEAVVDCGWGRLIFGQTFATSEMLANVLRSEKPSQRDVALYMRDPHVVVSMAPQDLFLDPSLTYRLAFDAINAEAPSPSGVVIRHVDAARDEAEINRIYQAHHMVPVYPGYFAKAEDNPAMRFLVAEDKKTGQVVGVVTGVDHHEAFADPDNGSSLWSLAVDPQSVLPGVGECLVRQLTHEFQQAGRAFMDLSVMHDNAQAIALYEKLGFDRVPVYCLKNRNSINEKLFVGPGPETQLNVYARIIVDEARRRGIATDINDAEGGFFTLTLGGRSISCRESLSELTSSVAMSRCDDKAVTHRMMRAEGLSVPEQAVLSDPQDAIAFLKQHQRIVIKPARGEQGRGIFVDLRSEEEVFHAIEAAKVYCEKVLVEEFVEGEDLRVIVIDGRVVAGAVRKPAEIQGDGKHDIATLIEKQSRRRAAATDGESRIPCDEETERCIQNAGYQMRDVLPEDEVLPVRKTANLHTGGTIHDVTDLMHPELVRASIKAAQILDIPVVGLDLMVPAITSPGYHIIEANERPGLANHEPQPTVERFVDLLFPQTKALA